jgi:hypothetical protein
MIIRNKFNGYGFDGSRLCHDPVSAAIAAQAAGTTVAAATPFTMGTIAAATPAVVAPTIATTLPGVVGGAVAPGAFGAGVTAGGGLGGTTALPGMAGANSFATALPEIASNLAAAGNTGIMSGAGATELAGAAGSTLPTAGATTLPTATTLPPAGGTPFTPPTTTAAGPLPPAGNPMSPEYLAQQYPEAYQAAAQNAQQTGAAGQAANPPVGSTTYSYPSQTYNPATGGVDNVARTGFTPPSANAAPHTVSGKGLQITPDKAFGPDSSGIYKGFDPITNAPYETATVPKFTPPAEGSMTGAQVPPKIFETFGTPPKNPLQQGFETALQYVKDNPVSSGLGLMSVGQYLNKPEEPDKDKYKSKVDMSGFQPSIPEQPSFTPSYEYQSYAVGGPVEQMAAQNSVGMNTGYPMAGINTPMYSNPMMQRPEATNVIAPSADAGVGAFSGEPRFASGGISSAERREYGLRTRGERAAQSLTKTYEEMEEERQKEAMKLFGESSLPTPRPIARSRTQELSSPFSAAMAEHARLAKKSKVPVVPMPKTNLGDIDTYMDIPIEAAKGGIMHGLGGYSDGGRLLRGPGDGVSDSIPAVIGKRQPARLADGEFVIPARIVSELGNGSTEAGARKLYAMMERVQASRKKSIGKKKVAVNSKADKHLPA